MNDSATRPKLSIVVPVFNEKETVAEVLRRVRQVDIDKEIVVVDDGSTDGTREFLSALSTPDETRSPQETARGNIGAGNIRVFLHDKNRGKGAAVRRGILEARGEYILIQDADLEYNPLDYHQLLAPIDSGVADVVFGSRFLGGPHRVLYFWHYLGNKGLTSALQHVHEFEFDRRLDMLQSFSPRSFRRLRNPRNAFWIRARGDSKSGAREMASL